MPTGILFSNNGMPQTTDFAFVNGGYYTEGGLLGTLKSPSTVFGDVNCDGSVNAGDVTALYNYILNGDASFLPSSDVNNDGAINAGDVTAGYNIILGQN